MILDTIDNLEKYAALNPLFPKAIEFILKSDLRNLPLGRNEIQGDEIFANVMEVQPHTKEEIPIEMHRKYIDIQVPISHDETMGYVSVNDLPNSPYDDEKDVILYASGVLATDYFSVPRSKFTIFFPQDGHAPAITPVKMKKVIVKVLVR